MRVFYGTSISPAWVLLACFSLGARAQQPAPVTGLSRHAGAPTSAASSMGRDIAVSVVVTDRSGNAVPGLQEQDFKITDNKAPQKILSFDAVHGTATAADQGKADPGVNPGVGVKVLLLLDMVNTSFQSVSYEREQIEKFLRKNNGPLPVPVSLVLFTDTGTKVQNGFSRDRNDLIAALEKSKIDLRTLRRSAGFYGAVERFQLSLKTLQSLAARESSQPGRKLVIWISPGWPLLTGPRVELSTKEQEGLFQSAVQISQGLRQAHITLYSVDPLGSADTGFRTFYYGEFLKGVSAPRQVEAGNLALQVLAYQSGGLVLHSSNDVAGQIGRCFADADAFYRISIPAASTEHRDEYHRLEVVVDKPGLTARTRTGYYAQP